MHNRLPPSIQKDSARKQGHGPVKRAHADSQKTGRSKRPNISIIRAFILIPLLTVFTAGPILVSCKEKDDSDKNLQLMVLGWLYLQSLKNQCLGNEAGTSSGSGVFSSDLFSPESSSTYHRGRPLVRLSKESVEDYYSSVHQRELASKTTGEWVVVYRSGVSMDTAIAGLQGSATVSHFAVSPRAVVTRLGGQDESPWSHRMLVTPDASGAPSPEQTYRRLSALPGVEHAQPNYVYTALNTPDDPEFTGSSLWGLHNEGGSFTYPTPSGLQDDTITPSAGNDINAPEAWSTRTDCSSVVVAVLDSGVNYHHEDLAANMWTDGSGNYGTDTINADSDPIDDNGHGTHVAGTIAAVGNNATGTTGVCWTAKIMAIKGLDASGSGTSTAIADGIDYAVENGAKVINLSLGGPGFDTLIYEAIKRARGDGVVIAAAAGNSAENSDVSPQFPASYDLDNIISVASIAPDGTLSSFSNYGRVSVDLAAPGSTIKSTWPFTTTENRQDFATGSGNGDWTLETDWVNQDSGGEEANCQEISKATATYNYLANHAGTGPWCNDSNDKPNYANSATESAWGSLALGSYDNAFLRFYLNVDLEYDYDYLGVFAATGTGDPTSSDSNALQWYTGSTEDSYYQIKFPITSCAGGDCAYGFKMKTDSFNTGDGPGVVFMDVVGQTIASSAGTYEYNFESGTSMATPHVAGTAALIWAETPGASYLDVVKTIMDSADRRSNLSESVCTGGLLDASAAMDMLKSRAE